jgi:hypothetical protein
MHDEKIPPAAEHLAEAAATLQPTEPGIHLLTFTGNTEGVRCVDPATVDEWGLAVILRAFALMFAGNRACGLYTDVDGYDVHDTATGITICVDRHGNRARATTTLRSGEPVITSYSHRAVEESLLEMVAAGPGISLPLQPSPPPTHALTGRTRVPGARVRTGHTGTFAPDWAATADARGRWFASVGFTGRLQSPTGTAVTFTCHRDVASAIVTEHLARRERVASRLRQRGLRGDLATTVLNRQVPILDWDGPDLIIDERMVTGGAEDIRRITNHQGTYAITDATALRWRPVHISACARVITPDTQH